MQKTIYFCDITGTIFGSEKNDKEDYQKLNELLQEVQRNDSSDEIVFSLVSTDNEETVRSVQGLLEPYIGENVVFGRQFFDSGYYVEDVVVKDNISGKSLQMYEYLKDLGIDHIASVYFADDVQMFHMILHFALEGDGLSDKFHSIIPTKKLGLKEVNQLLENDLQKFYGRTK